MTRVADAAVCLRQTEWSETSQIAVLLTARHGLVRGLAKGSRRTGSRFDAGIEPLAIGELNFVLDPRKDLLTLTAWSTTDFPLAPRRSVFAFAAAVLVADAARALLAPLDHHDGAFDAVARALKDLEHALAPVPAAHTAAASLLRLLTAAGFDLALPVGTTDDVLVFLPADGAFVPQAADPAGTGWRVRSQTISFLLASSPLDPSARWTAAHAERAIRFLSAWIGDRTARPLESGAFLCRLLAAASA